MLSTCSPADRNTSKVNLLKKTILVAFLSLCLCGCLNVAQAQSARTSPAAERKTARFYRTEIYFGRSKPDGGRVSDDDWSDFLANTVTPRFPDGFTALKATGQYRERSGRIISEPSELLVFFYSASSKKESRAKIEAIRSAYMKRFNQESVMRADLPRSVRVSF